VLAVRLRSPSIYIHIKFVCMACEFLLWDVALFMYWTCEINCNLQAQHINNGNSCTINDECTQLYKFCNVKQISIPHFRLCAKFLKSSNLNFSTCFKVFNIHGIEVVFND
jgi:hypothetical protein